MNGRPPVEGPPATPHSATRIVGDSAGERASAEPRIPANPSEWRKAIWDTPGVQLQVKAAAIAIGEKMDWKGRRPGTNAYPTVETIAQMLNLRPSTARRWIREARNAGFIRLTQRGNRRNGATYGNAYEAWIPPTYPLPPRGSAHISARPGHQDPPGGQRATGHLEPTKEPVTEALLLVLESVKPRVDVPAVDHPNWKKLKEQLSELLRKGWEPDDVAKRITTKDMWGAKDVPAVLASRASNLLDKQAPTLIQAKSQIDEKLRQQRVREQYEREQNEKAPPDVVRAKKVEAQKAITKGTRAMA